MCVALCVCVLLCVLCSHNKVEMREPWYIEVYDLNNYLHKVEMRPGQVVYYEVRNMLEMGVVRGEWRNGEERRGENACRRGSEILEKYVRRGHLKGLVGWGNGVVGLWFVLYGFLTLTPHTPLLPSPSPSLSLSLSHTHSSPPLPLSNSTSRYLHHLSLVLFSLRGACMGVWHR